MRLHCGQLFWLTNIRMSFASCSVFVFFFSLFFRKLKTIKPSISRLENISVDHENARSAENSHKQRERAKSIWLSRIIYTEIVNFELNEGIFCFHYFFIILNDNE